jgi:beta-mannosidase
MHCINRILLVLACLSCCSGLAAGTTSLHGDWRFDYSGTSWPAHLPFSIHTSLLENKLIPDPFAGDNESGLQWIGRQDWTFTLIFDVDEQALLRQWQSLVFTGLDTYAEVYLNETLLLQADNAFRQWKVPCAGLLKRNGNILKIVFHSAELRCKALYDRYPVQLPGEERVMVRRPQFQFGWDWAPRYITCGLQDVALESWDDFHLEGVHIVQDQADTLRAKVTASAEIRAASAASVDLTLRNTSGGPVLAHATASLSPGMNSVPLRFVVDRPHLWWCNGSGEPYLYAWTLNVTDGRQSESKSIRTGIRAVRLVNDSDRWGRSFYFELNGRPVFMKGANYVPQDVFPDRVTDSAYRQLLVTAKEAGINMLRVWGGGQYQRDAFYDLCDEMGILIWQDFMYAGGMYPYDSAFLDNARAEALYQVKRLDNHPCMALWCGNNECSEGWHRWGWQDGFNATQREEIRSGYHALFGSILPEVVHEHSQTPYWESSPEFGRGDPRHTSDGDAHNWFVWHDGAPFDNYRNTVPRFMSEFGFQGMPSLETLRAMAPGSTLSLSSPAILAHQKHSRGFSIIDTYMTAAYGRVPQEIGEYVRLSQDLQADALQTGVAAHLAAQPRCMGSLWWQLNDCWPSVSWSLIDYYGRKKPAYDVMKRLFTAP